LNNTKIVTAIGYFLDYLCFSDRGWHRRPWRLRE